LQSQPGEEQRSCESNSKSEGRGGQETWRKVIIAVLLIGFGIICGRMSNSSGVVPEYIRRNEKYDEVRITLSGGRHEDAWPVAMKKAEKALAPCCRFNQTLVRVTVDAGELVDIKERFVREIKEKTGREDLCYIFHKQNSTDREQHAPEEPPEWFNGIR
jgi:hypothetical protein